MPADSASVLSKRDGVAIRMDKLDHKQTASYDRKRGSNDYRAMQKEFPGKYDKSIQQAQNYLDSLFKAGKL